MILRLSILLTFSLFFHSVAAQSVPHLHNFKYWTTQDGLSSSTFYSGETLIHDNQGMLWVGTSKGLLQFDGTQFHPLSDSLDYSNLLNRVAITALFLDRGGDLWIGTIDKGLFRRDHKTGRYQQWIFQSDDPNSLPDNRIMYLFEGQEEEIWVAAHQKGISRYRPATDDFETFLPIPDIESIDDSRHLSNIISGHTFDPNDEQVLWLSTVRGLFSFHLNQHTFTPYLFLNEWADPIEKNGAHAIRFMEMEGDSLLWLGTWGDGLWSFNIQDKQFQSWYKEFPSQDNWALNNFSTGFLWKDHQLFLGSPKGGMVSFNTQTKHFHRWSEQAFERDSVLDLTYLYPDQMGNIWGATSGRGLFLLAPQHQLFQKMHLPVDDLQDVCFDPVSNRIYTITNYSQRVFSWDWGDRQFREIPVSPSLKRADERFSAIDLDTVGRVWIPGNFQLFSLEVGAKQIARATLPELPKEEALRNAGIMAFDIDQQDRLWMGSAWKGMYQFDPEKEQITRYSQDTSGLYGLVNALWVIDVQTAPSGKVYYVSEKGFGWYDPQKERFDGYPYRSGNTNVPHKEFSKITAILPELNGRTWIGTYEDGLGFIQDGQSRNEPINCLTEAQGWTANSVYDLESDNQGNIWCVTEAGLSCVLKNGQATRNFGPAYGLKGIRALAKGPNGFMLALSGDGVYVFEPQDVLTYQTRPPKPSLNRFRIFAEEYPLQDHLQTGEPIALSYRQNFFSFDFGAIDFVMPSEIRYRYKLEGLDKDWVYADKYRSASYTNVNGGKFRFRLQAMHDNGPWEALAGGDSRQEIGINLIISKPIWKKWWFYGLIGLALLALVLSIYQLRIQQIRKEANLRNEFEKRLATVEMTALRAQMNPHFLFNSLNSIKGFIIDNDTKEASRYLTKFSRLIRLILQNSKHPLVRLSDELEALRLYIEMEALRFDDSFAFEMIVEPGLSLDAIEIPPLILQPYVENAIWHGLLHKKAKGHLMVHISQQENRLQCVIQDDGIGREKAAQLKSKSIGRNKSMGLDITQNRIDLTNQLYQTDAKVQIDDLYNPDGSSAGTRITVTIPIE
ncbi:MAG: histidine kinase [Bacteroidota bacterium]